MIHPGGHEWLELRRVHEGGVAKVAGIYLDHGCPTPGHLTEVFDRLTWTGLVTVADGDPLWELRRLHLTELGQARYAVLCEQRAKRQQPAHEPPDHPTRACPPGERGTAGRSRRPAGPGKPS